MALTGRLGTSSSRPGDIQPGNPGLVSGGGGAPSNAARWARSVFEIGTTSPLVYWASGAFAASGTGLVIWNLNHFEVAAGPSGTYGSLEGYTYGQLEGYTYRQLEGP